MNAWQWNTYTIHTPAAMFKGFTVTQFHTPEMAQALDKAKGPLRQDVLTPPPSQSYRHCGPRGVIHAPHNTDTDWCHGEEQMNRALPMAYWKLAGRVFKTLVVCCSNNNNNNNNDTNNNSSHNNNNSNHYTNSNSSSNNNNNDDKKARIRSCAGPTKHAVRQWPWQKPSHMIEQHLNRKCNFFFFLNWTQMSLITKTPTKTPPNRGCRRVGASLHMHGTGLVSGSMHSACTMVFGLTQSPQDACCLAEPPVPPGHAIIIGAFRGGCSLFGAHPSLQRQLLSSNYTTTRRSRAVKPIWSEKKGV